MKQRFKLLIVFTVVILFGVSSCKKEDGMRQDLNDDVLKRYLEIKSAIGSFQENNSSKNMEVLGASILMSQNKNLKDAGDSTVPDSVIWDKWTCAKVTDSIDEDGNNITVYDYGIEGCSDWGSLIKGKVTYIWAQRGELYYSKVIYTDYSAYGMTMNGFSEYNYSMDNISFTDDSTAKINWSGFSSCVDNIEMVSGEGETFVYAGNYSSEWENNSYTVHTGQYSYKNLTKGYEYTYKVSKDLFYNYQCADTYVPVKGIEEIIQKENNVRTEFVTDYGDGTCDNLATITENGASYIVDFGEQWFWQDCKGTDCDSTVVVVNEGE